MREIAKSVVSVLAWLVTYFSSMALFFIFLAVALFIIALVFTYGELVLSYVIAGLAICVLLFVAAIFLWLAIFNKKWFLRTRILVGSFIAYLVLLALFFSFTSHEIRDALLAQYGLTRHDLGIGLVASLVGFYVVGWLINPKAGMFADKD